MALFDKPFGLAGERKALAILCLTFYMLMYGLLSLLLYNAPPDQPEVRGWWLCFAALAGTYGVAFFALAADWFWARWFAIGLGYSGLTVAGWGMVTQKAIDPVMLFYGATHGAIALFLQGQKLAQQFDLKPGWRELLRLDEHGVERVRASVTRAAASLPTLILVALAPREETGEMLLLAGVGLCGLLLLRTWGVMLLGVVGALLPLMLLSGHGHVALPMGHQALLGFPLVHQLGLISSAYLLAASAPFLRPIASFLKSRTA